MKQRALRNRTLTCSDQELRTLGPKLRSLHGPVSVEDITDSILHQDFFEAAPYLPQKCIDLLIMDPPYNRSKNYHGHVFKAKTKDDYQDWFLSILDQIQPLLKPTATLYVCSDWKTSILIAPLLEQTFQVRNRITWEREKGRGSTSNWKNNTEDIWFCTVSEHYTFNIEAVKHKRRVMAPYRHENGTPKDWIKAEDGKFRLTHPSNLWTDLSVPFWSMPENTDHPTQKPEKLMAKLILASSNPGDLVLDPFLGSGTTAVVAQKLHRHFIGIDINQEYCSWALKRLNHAEADPSIQGYADGVFWERNTLHQQPKGQRSSEVQTMPSISDGKQ